MAAAGFIANAVLQFGGQQYRLHRKVGDGLWQLEETRTLRIFEYSLNDLLRSYAAGELLFVPQCAFAANGKRLRTAVSEIPEDDMKSARICRAYVKAVMHLPATKSVMEREIEDTWAKLQQPARKPSWGTVQRWRNEYLDAKRDIRAFIRGHGNRGRWERFPKDLFHIVEDAIDNIWMTLERPTIQDTVDHAQARVDAENVLRPSSMALPRVSRRFVHRLIHVIPAFDRCAARYGIQIARARFRGVKGHQSTAAPLERVEIDSTVMDLFVVDDDKWLPLGRPTLTVCIDDYTRCVLGIDISFEPPSYVCVSRCLRQAFMPKLSLKDDYPDITNQWSPFGLMRNLVVDNAMEYHSDALDRACETLGVDIVYAPRKTPWYKGKIERFIGTFNKAHRLPGTTFSNIFERADYDPAEHAVIRLSTLQLLARKWIVDVYHQKVHRALQAPPAAVWDNSIRIDDVPLPSSLQELDAVMGRRAARVLTHKGIEFDLFYNSPELIDMRRRLGEKLDVEISVDDSDLGMIYVFDPKERGDFYPANALMREYATGLTRWQHKVIKKYAAEKMRRYDTAAWIKAKEELRALAEAEYTGRKKTRKRAQRLKMSAAKPAMPKPEPLPSPRADLTPTLPRSLPPPKYHPVIRELRKPI